MRRILLGLGLIGVITGGAMWAGTTAFFSDSETSEGNTFAAGALDLRIDSTAHYNGMVCADDGEGNYRWESEGTGSINPEDPDTSTFPQLLGTTCTGSWTETDLGVANVFFDYADIKPGDSGENTISMHVYNNDAWLRFMVFNLQNLENEHLENEIEAGDDSDVEGEMQDNLLFSVFIDQGSTPGFQNIDADGNPVDIDPGTVGIQPPDPEEGNNILDPDTFDAVVASEGTIDELGEAYDLWPILANEFVRTGCNVTLGDVNGDTNYGDCHGLAEDGRAVASTTYYFGINWRLPETVGNEVQTDAFLADIRFEAEQWRNNPNPSPAVLPTPTPTPGP